MPTLVETAQLDTFNEIAVEGFDLERLARLSETPAIEVAPARRFRLRASVAALLLATMVVSVLATLPASAAAFARACSLGN